jgi:hypothetical protein
MLGTERSDGGFPQRAKFKEMDQSMVGLQGLLAKEPVECGVYIGYGKRNMVDLVLDVLAKKMPAEVIWIDAGNSFDPYRLSVSVRRRGGDPRRILKAIQVARPFTAFQLHEVLAKVPAGPIPPLVIISDLMGLFYDSELREEDMLRAFRQFQVRLEELGRRAVVFGLVLARPVATERKHLLAPILESARRVFVPACTAREDLTVPVKRVVVTVCSFLVLGGVAMLKKAAHLFMLNVLYLVSARG